MTKDKTSRDTFFVPCGYQIKLVLTSQILLLFIHASLNRDQSRQKTNYISNTQIAFHLVGEIPGLRACDVLLYMRIWKFEKINKSVKIEAFSHTVVFCINMEAPRIYHQTSIISRTSVGNEIVDHSDVVGASPVGAAPATSSFSTYNV